MSALQLMLVLRLLLDRLLRKVHELLLLVIISGLITKMPIGNHSSHKLQVTTNVGGKLYENEEVTQLYYHGTKSEKPPTPPVASFEVFGSNQPQVQATEVEIAPELEKAINEDLASRGLAKIEKPRKQTKNKTKACSQATNKPKTN